MVLPVVFADDDYLVREGVSALLAEVDEIDLVATATDPHSLVKAVAEHLPDAVLTDIRMPPTHTNEGIEAAKRIRAEFPTVGVVVPESRSRTAASGGGAGPLWWISRLSGCAGIPTVESQQAVGQRRKCSDHGDSARPPRRRACRPPASSSPALRCHARAPADQGCSRTR